MVQKLPFPLRDEGEVPVEGNSNQVGDLEEASDAEALKMKRGMV